jgi:hypothetical protein
LVHTHGSGDVVELVLDEVVRGIVPRPSGSSCGVVATPCVVVDGVFVHPQGSDVVVLVELD